MDSHTMPHLPVYTAISWNPAIEHSKLQPLLMKTAALTNAPHPTTPIMVYSTCILIRNDGDNKLASNNQMLLATK